MGTEEKALSHEKESSYEEDVQRIEQIIAALGQPSCGVDDLIGYVKEAADLIEKCRKKLSGTTLEVNMVLGRLNPNPSEQTVSMPDSQNM